MAYSLRAKVLEWAILSRLFILSMQALFNVFIPDHQSDAFTSPQDEDNNILDSIITYLFGGLGHWDGQHFLHISKYGYTYENNLAFFPIYPIIIKITANTIALPLQLLFTYHNVLLFSGLVINFVCFVLSVEIFYEFSRQVLREERLAYRAALLYCINPASIFFSAVYSESIYALCVFTGMLLHEKKLYYGSCLSFGFGSAVRANGIINCGFPLYRTSNEIVSSMTIETHQKISFMFVISLIGRAIPMLMSVCVIVAPFFAHQWYAYVNYCEKPQIAITSAVKEYGLKENLVMPDSSGNEPAWCFNIIPMSYSAIQEKYWNVGFLKYYELKQIPNFLLSTPIVLIILTHCIYYCIVNHRTVFQLGLGIAIKDKDDNLKYIGIHNNPLLFVYVIHGLIILTFGLLFINVQVLTRMMCSSSPLIYWFSALMTSPDESSISLQTSVDEKSRDFKDIETRFNLSRWGDNILLDQIQKWDDHSWTSSIIFIYYLTYFVFGTAMFANSFPFT